MPLIKCADCGTEVSDSAPSCPKCARPIAPQKKEVTPGQKAAKTFFGVVRILVVTALAILIAICALVIYLNKHGHPVELGDMVSKTVVPRSWNDRASEAMTAMLERDGQTLARSIQNITHPTGKAPSMSSYEVRHSGDHLSVRMNVNWQGGILSTPYNTTVIWELSQQNHISTAILNDTSPTSIDRPNMQRLDTYFRGEVYPVLTSNSH